MFLEIVLLFPIIFLIYKKYKFTLITYALLYLIFIIYLNFYFDIEGKEGYEISAEGIKALPFQIFGIMLLIISMYYDLTKK